MSLPKWVPSKFKTTNEMRLTKALTIAMEALEKDDRLMSFDPLKNYAHCHCRKEIREDALRRIEKLGGTGE